VRKGQTPPRTTFRGGLIRTIIEPSPPPQKVCAADVVYALRFSSESSYIFPYKLMIPVRFSPFCGSFHPLLSKAQHFPFLTVQPLPFSLQKSVRCLVPSSLFPIPEKTRPPSLLLKLVDGELLLGGDQCGSFMAG